jgi:hypothetical protein
METDPNGENKMLDSQNIKQEHLWLHYDVQQNQKFFINNFELIFGLNCTDHLTWKILCVTWKIIILHKFF